MPLTPQSRVYEDKLARTRKKYESRNAFANERSKKAQEQFSSPAPKESLKNYASLKPVNNEFADSNIISFVEPFAKVLAGTVSGGLNAASKGQEMAYKSLGVPRGFGVSETLIPRNENADNTILSKILSALPVSNDAKEKAKKSFTSDASWSDLPFAALNAIPSGGPGGTAVGSTFKRQNAGQIAGILSDAPRALRQAAPEASTIQGMFSGWGKAPQMGLFLSETALERAKHTGKTLEQTASEGLNNRFNKAFDENPIVGFDGRTVTQVLEDNNLGPFRDLSDTIIDKGSVGIHRSTEGLISNASINDVTSMMEDIAGTQGSMVQNVVGRVKNGILAAPKSNANAWQNDHTIPVSFVRHLIERSIKDNKGILNDQWHQDAQALVDFVNDPNNIRRINGWFNQSKKHYNFDYAAPEFVKKFPNFAKNQVAGNYRDYTKGIESALDELGRATTNFGDAGAEWAKATPGSQFDLWRSIAKKLDR